MDKSNFVSLVVAVLAFLSALAAQRQSAKANKDTADASIVNTRIDAETEAYVRARAMDTETIKRQGQDLVEVRREMVDLRAKCELLEEKNDALEDKYEKVLKDNRRLRERIVELENAS